MASPHKPLCLPAFKAALQAACQAVPVLQQRLISLSGSAKRAIPSPVRMGEGEGELVQVGAEHRPAGLAPPAPAPLRGCAARRSGPSLPVAPRPSQLSMAPSHAALCPFTPAHCPGPPRLWRSSMSTTSAAASPASSRPCCWASRCARRSPGKEGPGAACITWGREPCRGSRELSAERGALPETILVRARNRAAKGVLSRWSAPAK